VIRHLAWWLGWWVALFWLWLLISGDWNRIEIVAAACGATLAASLAEVARARAGVEPRIPLRWIGRAWTVPHQIVVDFWIITATLFRSIARRQVVRGVFRAHPFPAGEGPGVRAWAVWAANFSPNAYVIHVDEERELVLFHDLVPNDASEEPA
jgi:hypothetical protein